MEKRSKNLKQKEKEEIVNIILKYKNIIECKKTDAISVKQKNDTWEKILVEFNSDSEQKRNIKQLKTYYKNAKAELRKQIAVNKAELYKTGGGTSAFTINENNPLLSIVNEQSTPIPNEFDSSNDIFTNQDIVGSEDEDFIENINSLGKSSTKTGENTKRLKKRNHAMVQEFCEEITTLKKRKLEAEIEKNKAKTEVYKIKLEILNRM